LKYLYESLFFSLKTLNVYYLFYTSEKEKCLKFKKIIKEKTVKIISHLYFKINNLAQRFKWRSCCQDRYTKDYGRYWITIKIIYI